MKDSDKYIDEFSKKVVKSAGLETPSFDFTASVMAKIESTKAPSRVMIRYEPLIPKKVWLGIAAIVVAMVFVVFLGGRSGNANWSLAPFTNLLSWFVFSRAAFYGILGMVAMFLINIPILKHHFDRRLELR